MKSIELSNRPIYIRHSDLRVNNIRHLDLDLCDIINEHTPHHVRGAQKKGGIWMIWMRSDQAREHILKKIVTIRFNDRNIELHDENPFTTSGNPSEKIVFKDLPMHLSGTDVIKHLEENYPHIVIRSEAILSRIPSRNNNLSKFYNGDRIVYAKEGFFPVLPKETNISGAPCKIWHPNQNIFCERCTSDTHRTFDTQKCGSYSSDPGTVVFKHDNDPLSNYYPCTVSVFNREWPSSEHAYQGAKMIENKRPDLASEVLKATSAASAKFIAGQLPPCDITNWNDELKLSTMRKILSAKSKSCPEFRQALIDGKNKLFVEGTKKSIFWGAGLTYSLACHTRPDKLIGQNHLGQLLGELRDNIISESLPISDDVNGATSSTSNAASDPETVVSSSPTNITAICTNTVSTTPTPSSDATSITTYTATPVTSPSSVSTPTAPHGVSKCTEHPTTKSTTEGNATASQTPKPKRRPRSITRLLNSRCSSLSRMDNSDMRPIVDFFTPVGKRKATDATTSPTSDIDNRMSKSRNIDDTVSDRVLDSDTM